MSPAEKAHELLNEIIATVEKDHVDAEGALKRGDKAYFYEAGEYDWSNALPHDFVSAGRSAFGTELTYKVCSRCDVEEGTRKAGWNNGLCHETAVVKWSPSISRRQAREEQVDKLRELIGEAADGPVPRGY